jgi:hypothetical protein
MEQEPKRSFSLEEFLNSHKQEESADEYSYGDPGAPAHNFEMMLKKVPDRISLIEKILDPSTQEEEIFIAVKRLGEMNTDSAQEEGLYESAVFELKNHSSVEFRLFNNGLFIANLDHGITRPAFTNNN